MTERAFAMRKANANAVHALLHAMFEDGSVADADTLVTEWIPTYDRSGILYGQYPLAPGARRARTRRRGARTCDLRRRAKPTATRAPPLNAVTDGASLLWRLAAYGHAVPDDLWADADVFAQAAFPKSSIPCRRAHGAVCRRHPQPGRAGSAPWRESKKRIADGKLRQGRWCQKICRAMHAFAGED